jgi:hypothetical protein
VTPFFLTKIRYPRYLSFRGKVQVGVSAMPEPVRQWLAPHGSPADELLESLRWAVAQGAVDPVIRLGVVWEDRDYYPHFLQQCCDVLSDIHWRLTLDILRFTPGTATIIERRYPEAAKRFAKEIAPGSDNSLSDLAKAAKQGAEHVKKLRPPESRQAEIYRWFRHQLDSLGHPEISLTPCKGTLLAFPIRSYRRDKREYVPRCRPD